MSLFEHDPTTNKLLWFSGPPLDMPPPSTYTPRYSTKYLAFLARQREEKQRKDGLSNTMDTDENGEGRAAKRQRMDLDEGEGEAREQNTGDAYVGGPIPTMMELVEKYLDGDAYLDDSLLEMEQEPPIGAAQNLERGLVRKGSREL